MKNLESLFALLSIFCEEIFFGEEYSLAIEDNLLIITYNDSKFILFVCEEVVLQNDINMTNISNQEVLYLEIKKIKEDTCEKNDSRRSS